MTVQSLGDETVVRAGSLTVTIPGVGVEESSLTTPAGYKLSENLPNPFTSATAISYQLPQESEVSLVIYDASGRAVRTLVSGRKDAGYHTVSWDTRNGSGKAVPAGVYFYRFQAGDYREIRKMILLK